MNSRSTNMLQRPIGRNIQFIDPFIGSNRKHYWESGEGNLGFLTSEQIQILKSMKQKERNMNALNHLRSSYENIEISLTPVAAESVSKAKIHTQFLKNSHEVQTPKTKKGQKIMNRENKSFFSNSKREIQSQNNHHSTSSKQNTPKQKPLQSTQKQTKENSKNKSLKKPMHSRRIKTLDIEKIYNPEGLIYEKVDSEKQVGQKFRRKVRSRIDIHSKSVNIQVHPEFHSQSKKITNHQVKVNQAQRQSKDFSIEKSQIQLKPQSKLTIKTQVPVQNQPQSQPIYRSKKFLSTKVHTRTKFRRDYSPTFCNSFGYPLSCYRYVE